MSHLSHTIDIDAPVEVVYGVIADATAWPQHFAPTIRVERSAVNATGERLRIWATANGEVKSWTSRRELDPAARRISFRQEVSAPPVASMAGEWLVTSVAGGSRLTLRHDFTATDDDPAGLAWITEVTDRNSEIELANVKAVAQRWDRLPDLVFSFSDSVAVDGSAQAVYDFLRDAARWSERLPHVARLDISEDVPGIQWMAMDTRTKDGSTHTTESVRICEPDRLRITYKQLVPPSLMTAHTGVWTVRETPEGAEACSEHTVTVNEATVTDVLGPDATVATARDFIRRAAGGNSVATLELAKKHVENSVA